MLRFHGHRLLLVGALVALGSSANLLFAGGDTRIVVKVVDASGQRLPGAAVRLSYRGATTVLVTGDDGEADFPARPRQPYALQVSFPHLADAHVERVRVGAGKRKQVTVTMVEGPAEWRTAP